ncbi:endonuclease/exonuclease/phosphatase family protein [Methanosarcina barkeri]|nr:endonuclease/exonuclease/phosphatase family protein [Methanosarcina barkeri]
MDSKLHHKFLIYLAVIFVFLPGCIDSTEQMNVDSAENSDSGYLSRVSDAAENPSQSSEGSSRVIHAEAEDSSVITPYAEETVTENQSGLVAVNGTSLSSHDNGSQEETLRIGAFNIQVFGVKKASNPKIMNTLAKVLRTYDIVAVQEIRDSSQTALPALIKVVNSERANYSYVVSERLGRTSSKEQYAYIYDSDRVKLEGEPYTYSKPEGTDPFHRQPYIATFEDRNETLNLVLITVHTDPDEATEEINSLSTVLDSTRQTCPVEDNFVIMGDLNADGSYFDENKANSLSCGEYCWLIDNSMDTTTGDTNCTYDRIIITEDMESYFTGNSGLFRYDLKYNLTSEETNAVSDHYPVYAEFAFDSTEA